MYMCEMGFIWAENKRIKNRLYKYTSNEYPHKTKDLILTSCNSILVDGITDQTKANILSVLNDL